jgi:hypothetical protein
VEAAGGKFLGEARIRKSWSRFRAMRANAADARNFVSRWFNSRRKVQDFWLLNQGDKKSAP